MTAHHIMRIDGAHYAALIKERSACLAGEPDWTAADGEYLKRPVLCRVDEWDGSGDFTDTADPDASDWCAWPAYAYEHADFADAEICAAQMQAIEDCRARRHGCAPDRFVVADVREYEPDEDEARALWRPQYK